MQIFQDALSPTTIDVFRKHYADNKDDDSINQINSHEIDIRTMMLPGTEAFAEVRKLCLKHFPDTEDNQIYANYQRQTKPTFMHVDEYGKNRKQKTWTIIIPMHTDERLGVVLFKEMFNGNEDLQEMIQTFEAVSKVKLNYEITERRAGDITELYASTKLAEEKLGWKAERNIDEMIRSSWEWEQNLRSEKE